MRKHCLEKQEIEDELDRVYYPRVRSILKASPIPDGILQTDFYLSSRILLELAAKAGLNARKIDIAFDGDIVRQEIACPKVFCLSLSVFASGFDRHH